MVVVVVAVVVVVVVFFVVVVVVVSFPLFAVTFHESIQSSGSPGQTKERFHSFNFMAVLKHLLISTISFR